MSQQHVIFGTGPLGAAVARALVAHGENAIRMINRSGNRRDLPAAVEVIASDAYNVANVREVTRDADVVYQCAQPAYTDWKTKFPPLQRAILEGTAANTALLVVGDNLYMYGDTDGQRIHEELPYAATGKKGIVRAEMAQEVLDWHAAGKVQATLARGSDFYGRGVLGSTLGERVFEPLFKGEAAQVFGDIDQPHTYTYIDDFGKAMVILGQDERALGRAWHVPNAPIRTTREVIGIIADELDTAPKINPMPSWLFNVLSLVHPLLRELREMRYAAEKPYIVDDSDFVETFGNHATPLREGISETLAWYREHLAVTA